MTVQEAKDITREWLLARVASLPDLQGAFFHGSITWLSDEDDMPPEKLLAAHTPPAPPDFYERLLGSVHFAQLDAPTVGRWLHALEPAFDAARDCIRSPYRFAADISDTGRPIAIDQSWKLVHAGLHREAMFWILATWCRCMHILTVDASPVILECQTGEFQQLLTSLGITSFQQRQESNRVAANFLKEVWTVCKDIIARNPEIIDAEV
jgi:hypothetical protein